MSIARLTLLIFVVGACSSTSGSNPPTGDYGGGARGAQGGGTGVQAGGDSGGTGSSAGGTGTSPEPSGGGSSGQGTGASTSGGSSSGGANSQPTGGASGSSTTGGSGGACVDVSASTTPLPAVLEFQIDITNSMTRTTPTTGGVSKWVATQNALKNALPQLPQDWLVGISFFNKPANVCYTGTQAVDIAPLSQNLSSIISAINGIQLDNTPTWTPTLKAWQFAYDYVTNQWPARAQYARNDKYIIFLTDGIPTVDNDGCTIGTSCTNACISQAEYDTAVSTIAATGTAQARTYFIGVPGSEEQQGAPYNPRVMLSRMAIAGGTAPAGCTPDTAAAGNYCHLDLTSNADFATALAQAIKAIGQQVISCTYKVPPPPDGRLIDPKKIAITYTTGAGVVRELKRASDSACNDGQWYVSAVDGSGVPTDLSLCPDSCDTVTGDPGASVLVTFACNERL
jgi:hypothetical protein